METLAVTQSKKGLMATMSAAIMMSHVLFNFKKGFNENVVAG